MTTYLADLREGLAGAFARSEKVVFLGEDILDPYGGAFKVSQGLSTSFPARVLTTPVSEAGIVGVATGLAIRGFRPVVEIMFGDFLTLCSDQIVNHATKFEAMYGGRVSVPLVVRTPMGGGRGYGPTHSQTLEKLFLGTPGLTIMAPSHLHNPGTLLQRAIFEIDHPVLFIENKLLYPLDLVRSRSGFVFEVKPGPGGCETVVVDNFESGDPDVTVITYGGMSRQLVAVLDDLAREEIRVCAVLPASLQPMHDAALVEAGARSGRVVVVEEGMAGFDWGATVASLLYERLWGQLKRPIRRVASVQAVIPTAARLERDVLVAEHDIEKAIIEMLE